MIISELLDNLSEETFKELKKNAVAKTLKPNTFIAKEGEYANKFYLLNEGVITTYLLLDSGKEVSKNLFFSVCFVAPLTALLKDKPSLLNYKTITKCEVLEIDFSLVRKIMSKNIEVKNLYIKILENVFINYEKRQLELISLNATERYLKLREKIPTIDNLISQYQIASYLNITPVQLSRIRKKLHSN